MQWYQRRAWRIIGLALLTASLLMAVSATDIYKQISDSIRLYHEVYRQVILNYADQINASELTDLNIRNMLSELDPYTVFLTEEEKEPLDVLSQGEYGGVGLRISIRKDTVTVISSMDGSPARKANIFPGDQILKVDTAFTKGLNLDKTARLMRGKPGTKVDLLIRRPGFSVDKTYSLIRDKIQVNNISYAGFLEDGIGYIRLTEFSKGATSEVKKTIAKLENENSLQALILDLRGNPGGLLEEALGIAELFTEIGDTLLFTRGRTDNANRVFVARNRPMLDRQTKIAVLIDGGSASASEIVAGIIQDVDRGIVVGSPSFGKGLVQTVFRVDRQYSVKITTAKYYIPSGRLIQKPDYIKNSKLLASAGREDSIFYSRNRRLLRSNGGITPDVTVTGESLPEYVVELWRQNAFFSFAMKYKTEQYRVPARVDEKVLARFQQYLKETGFTYTDRQEKSLREVESQLKQDARFQNLPIAFDQYYARIDSLRGQEFDKNIEYIKQGLESEFGTLEDGIAGRVKAELRFDKVVARTRTLLKNDVVYGNTLGYSH